MICPSQKCVMIKFSWYTPFPLTEGDRIVTYGKCVTIAFSLEEAIDELVSLYNITKVSSFYMHPEKCEFNFEDPKEFRKQLEGTDPDTCIVVYTDKTPKMLPI